jgi:hypothetical protein
MPSISSNPGTHYFKAALSANTNIKYGFTNFGTSCLKNLQTYFNISVATVSFKTLSFHSFCFGYKANVINPAGIKKLSY